MRENRDPRKIQVTRRVGARCRHRPACGVVLGEEGRVEPGARDHLLAENRARIDFHQDVTAVARVAPKLDRRGSAMAADSKQLESELGDLRLVRNLLGATVARIQRELPDLSLRPPRDWMTGAIDVGARPSARLRRRPE